MKKILIYGWYGENNYGDELLLKSVKNMICSCNESVIINVMGSNPREIKKNHTNVNRVSKTFFLNPKKVLSVLVKDPINTFINLKENDLLVVAGGGAISDWNNSSTREMFFLINYFFRRNKKVFLLGVGAGPISNPQSYKYFHSVLSKATAITTRDDYSLRELEKIGLNNICLGKDLSYYSQIENNSNRFPQKIDKIGIVLAPVCMNSKEIYEQFISETRKLISELMNKYQVSLIPFQYEYDKKLLEKVVNNLEKITVLYDPNNIWSVEKFVADQDLIIGMRYHSLILSAMLKKYIIPIIYHPKNMSFCLDYNLEEYSESIGNGENWKESNISASGIIGNINKLINDDRYCQRIEDGLKRKKSHMVERELIKMAVEE